MTLPTVHSFYRSNIPDVILSGQRAVFDHLGIELRQHHDDKVSHGQWMQRLFETVDDEIIVVADIDAFPLSRTAFQKICEVARNGGLAGLAQVANHKDPDRIYAGPMFLAVSRATYTQLGAPGLERTPESDVAQLLTDAAAARGVPVHLIYPSGSVQPKWALSDKGMFGIGTFYGEMEFFHLFQSRKRSSVTLFEAVSRDVIAGQFRFADYLRIMSKRSIWSRLTG